MKLNAIERVAMNNPLRAAHQHYREAEWFDSLGGGALSGLRVLEVGCGRGVGVEVLLKRLDAAHVTAFDLDPDMIERARRRLRLYTEKTALSVGDVCEIEQTAGSFDAVADFGIVHHVPDWRRALGEIARVLRPGGLLLFEEVPRATLDTWAFRTFTEHPRDDRFEADEFADALALHGLRSAAAIESHIGGMVFAGAARKGSPGWKGGQ